MNRSEALTIVARDHLADLVDNKPFFDRYETLDAVGDEPFDDIAQAVDDTTVGLLGDRPTEAMLAEAFEALGLERV